MLWLCRPDDEQIHTEQSFCTTSLFPLSLESQDSACYWGNRMRRSGLECHPQASECWVSRQWQGPLALLSPWQLNYSLNGGKSAGDPANFSMGLLAVLVRSRRAQREMICEYVSQYIYEMDISHTFRRGSLWLVDLCFLNRCGPSCFQGRWTATESDPCRFMECTHTISSCFKGWGLCQFSSSKRVCLRALSFPEWHGASEACRG